MLRVSSGFRHAEFQFAGTARAGQMFYWFVEAQQDAAKAPLILSGC